MKKPLLLIVAILFCAGLVAQNKMNEINQIKRDKGYLYGEATLNTKEAALSLAYELLESEIRNWAKEKSNKISSVVASHINEYADTIILPRHNMVRAFAYVKISNLNPIKGKSLKVDVDEDKNSPVSMPVVDVAQPAVQPVTAPTAGKAVIPAVSNAPKTEEKHDYTKEVLDELKKVTSFYTLENTIKPLNEQGKITGYGKYSAMSDRAGSYLIIYDTNANIRAILGKGTSVRKNLSTGMDDSEKNYKGCGAIWFKIKE